MYNDSEYFCDHEDECDDREVNLFRKKSSWTPPSNRDAALETYVKAVKRNIDKTLHQVPRKRRRDKLTFEERKALSSLKKRTDINL